MAYYEANNVNPADDLESAADFQAGEMYVPLMDYDQGGMVNGMDIPFEDSGDYYDEMVPPMMCDGSFDPFTNGEPSSLVQRLPQLEGGDKDKSVALFNYMCKTCRFLKDEKGRFYVCRSGFNAVPLGSQEFDELLTECCVNELGMMLGSTTISSVKQALGPIIKMYAANASVGRRAVYSDGRYHYKFDDTTVLQIAEGNFYCGVSEGVYFASTSGFKSQVIPDFTTPATELPGLVEAAFNVHSGDLLRFLAHLSCFFMPHISVPLLILSGGHGTSKTTCARKIISLVDPDHTDVVSMPKDDQGLTALLAAKSIVGIDNIGKISRNYSDKFCIACTGGYDPQRQLYTNADLLNVPLKCNIILNGIGTLVTRPDLAERSNVIYFNKVKHRLTDRQVWDEFESMKPKLLGGIFNVIRLGLPMVNTVLEGYTPLPRMADFAEYGAAFIKAMGLDPIQFVKEYSASCSAFIGDCAELDEFYSLVKEFLVNRRGYYQDTAQKLLEDLQNYAGCKRISFDKMSPSSLSRRLHDGMDDLNRMDVEVAIKQDTPKSITLQLKSAAAQQAATPVGN